jgi:Ger(x)C family germination protein
MRKILLLLLSGILLVGCWDRDLLRDVKLVTMMGFDRAEDGKLITTVITRETPTGAEEGGRMVNVVYSTVSTTSRQGQMFINLEIPGHFRAYKNQAILFGEARAREDIYPVMDVVGRDPRNNISARVAVVEGRAVDLLELNLVKNELVGEYVDDLLLSMEQDTRVPEVNVQRIYPILLDEGQDFALPLLRFTPTSVEVSGLALFRGHHMSGRLNTSESTMLLLLADQRSESARFTYKVDPGEADNPANYLTLHVSREQYQRDIRVSETGDVHVDIVMKLQLSIEEYARDDFENEKNVKRLERQLGEGLEKQARETLQKMKQARCDYLGIGRHLIAFYPEVWKKKKWSRDYRKVRFHPQIEVEILDSGILE